MLAGQLFGLACFSWRHLELADRSAGADWFMVTLTGMAEKSGETGNLSVVSHPFVGGLGFST